MIKIDFGDIEWLTVLGFKSIKKRIITKFYSIPNILSIKIVK